MGTKNNPGDFDCYENAEPDEPMFVLLARDESAPELVRDWVEMRRARLEEAEGDVERPFDTKELEALACADAMEAWRLSEDKPHEGASG